MIMKDLFLNILRADPAGHMMASQLSSGKYLFMMSNRPMENAFDAMIFPGHTSL
jgi:hypothetical protein